MTTANDALSALAFRAMAVYFRRIGDGKIATALTDAADALAPNVPDEHGLTPEQYLVRVDAVYQPFDEAAA